MEEYEKVMFNHIDYWATVVDSFSKRDLCDIAVIGNSGFVFDDDGFIGIEFDIVGSGIKSRATREIVGNIVNRELCEFDIVYA